MPGTSGTIHAAKAIKVKRKYCMPMKRPKELVSTAYGFIENATMPELVITAIIEFIWYTSNHIPMPLALRGIGLRIEQSIFDASILILKKWLSKVNKGASGNAATK